MQLELETIFIMFFFFFPSLVAVGQLGGYARPRLTALQI